MTREDEATFVLHGLDVDNRIVRADVFVQKLRALLRALHLADRLANGKPGFRYMLSHLETGSASVTIREKQRARERPQRSGIATFEAAATAVYNGDRNPDQMPAPLVEQVQRLGKGVARTFSHAEIAFSDSNVIRIDDFLLRQSDVAQEMLAHPTDQRKPPSYRGLAVGSFDGFLKEIDARGTVLRGKLVLSAGGIEIDCVMNKERVPEARESFDKRVIVEGVAHYDGEQQLPVRLDVRMIKAPAENFDLLRWRGALQAFHDDEVDDEW